MGSADTALALKLTPRQASDFELLANGGFAPLTGFLGMLAFRSPEDERCGPDGRYPWIPHSVRSVPAQRPARDSSPASAVVVQGMHPIDGYPWS